MCRLCSRLGFATTITRLPRHHFARLLVMHSGNLSVPPSTSTSSHVVSGGATKTRDQVDPSILADLMKSQHCDVETLLRVFLKLCRDQPLPSESIPPSDLNPSTPRLPSTDSSPDGSPGSVITARPSNSSGSTPKHTSPNPNTENQSADPPAQPEFFERCLTAVLPLCQNQELLNLLDEVKHAGKETQRYIPLTRFLNHALGLLASLALPGIRPVSDLNVLFVVNDPKHVYWRPGSSHRVPDLALLSLGTVKQVYQTSECNWDAIAKGVCLSGKRHKEAKLEWPDVLASVEVKWDYHPMRPDKPQTYNTSLGDPIGQISVARNQPDLAESISGNTTASSASVSISSLESHPSSDSIRGVSNAGDPAAASNGSGSRKRSGDHLDSANDNMHRNHNIPTNKIDVATQSGGCGAEMLHSSLGRRHAIGLVNI
ncbi:unnamed protein product, partial [Rhizoctonia solani]